MTWIGLEIPPGSALEADIQKLRQRIKQVVICYCIMLFATVAWMTSFSDVTQRSFNTADTLSNLCSPANFFPELSMEAACRRTFTFCFGEGGSLISDLTQYARAAAMARRMNYRILIDDSMWKYGQLSYYFDAQVAECRNTDQSPLTHKVKVGEEGWESKAHIFADKSAPFHFFLREASGIDLQRGSISIFHNAHFIQNSTVDLDNIFIKARSFDQPSMEGKTLIFDSHWSRKVPSLPALPAIGWWSDYTVFEEIKKVWNPNERIRDQVLQMVRKIKTSNSETQKPSQRLSFAKIGLSTNPQTLKITALLPCSPYIDEEVGRLSGTVQTNMTTLGSSFPTLENLYKPPSTLVVLFCDAKESEKLQHSKENLPQYADSQVISTPRIVYSHRSKSLRSTQMQLADVIIRDLVYANEISDRIVCHTTDVQCRFLLLLSSFQA